MNKYIIIFVNGDILQPYFNTITDIFPWLETNNYNPDNIVSITMIFI